jgi:hypothetical protein
MKMKLFHSIVRIAVNFDKPAVDSPLRQPEWPLPESMRFFIWVDARGLMLRRLTLWKTLMEDNAGKLSEMTLFAGPMQTPTHSRD